MKLLFIEADQLAQWHGPFSLHECFQDHGMGILLTLAAQAGKPFDVLSLKAMHSWAELRMRLKGYDTLAMNVRSWRYIYAKKAAEIFKLVNPNGEVWAGGMHATVAPQEMLAVPEFDVIVSGEGEGTWEELLDGRLPDTRLSRGSRGRYQNLDDLPFIDRSLWPRTPGNEWPLEGSGGWGPGPRAVTMLSSTACPFNCITGDSRIFVDGVGIVRIDNLQPLERTRFMMAGGSEVGALVKNIATDYGSKASSHWHNLGEQETISVTLRNGLSLTMTPDHRIRVIRNAEYVWDYARNIHDGDWVPVQHGMECWGALQALSVEKEHKANWKWGTAWTETGSYELDDELAWLVGFFIGNGAFHRNALDWACRYKEQADKVQDICARRFGKHTSRWVPKQSDKIEIVQCASVLIRSLFADALGLGAYKLIVPPLVFLSPRSVAQSFVQGLFDADGYTPKRGTDGAHISTISKELADGVALLLLNMGQYPTVTKVKQYSDKTTREYYYRVFTDMKANRVPIGKTAYCNNGKRGWRKGLRTDTIGATGVRVATVAAIEPGHDLISRQQVYSQVMSVISAGVQRVYDLTVPDGATFIANGFVSHNCSFCAPAEKNHFGNRRRRSVGHVLADLAHIRERWGDFTSIVFHDSEFLLEPAWLNEFLMRYPAEVGLPFWASCRADIMSKWPELTEALIRQANWHTISIGLESGSQKVLDIMNKQTTVEQNLAGIELVNKIGDDLVAEGKRAPVIFANVMLATPGEEPEDAFATVRMLGKIKRCLPSISWFTPYPGSTLGDKIIAEGRSLDSHKRYLRFPNEAKVAGIDYQFYVDLANGRYDRETGVNMRELMSRQGQATEALT